MDPHRSPAPLARCAAVAAAASLGFGALTGSLLPMALAGEVRDLDAALVRVCAVAALVAAAWLWLGTLRLVLAARGGRGGHAFPAGLPASVRRLVLAACGVALTGALTVAAAQAVAVRSGDGAGLPYPDRADGRAQVAQPATTVRPGDSLWSIAAETLPAQATAAEVAARWQRIYALNRDLIGPDPDLILPAQRLTLPAR